MSRTEDVNYVALLYAILADEYISVEDALAVVLGKFRRNKRNFRYDLLIRERI